MTRCGWCNAAIPRTTPLRLCGSCARRREAAIAHLVARINADLDLMVAFDAYYYARSSTHHRPPVTAP